MAGVLLRPLPYRQPERLVMLEAVSTRPPFDSNGSVSYEDFEQLKMQSRSFENLAITYRMGWSMVTLTGGPFAVTRLGVYARRESARRKSRGVEGRLMGQPISLGAGRHRPGSRDRRRKMEGDRRHACGFSSSLFGDAARCGRNFRRRHSRRLDNHAIAGMLYQAGPNDTVSFSAAASVLAARGLGRL